MPTGREIVEQREAVYPLASLVPPDWTAAAQDAISQRRQTWVDVLAEGKTFDCDDAARHIAALDALLEAIGAEPKPKARKKVAKLVEPDRVRERLDAERAAVDLALKLTPQGWDAPAGILSKFEGQREKAFRKYLEERTYEALAEYQELTWWLNHLWKVEHAGDLAAKRLREAPIARVA